MKHISQIPSVILSTNYETLKRVFDRYHVTRIRIFGSVARREDKETSDVDFLVDLPPDMTMLQYGKLRYELDKILSVPFDMLTYAGLNPKVTEHFIRNSIAFEQVPDGSIKIDSSEQMTIEQRVMKNLKSVVWVIDRIKKSLQDVDKERFWQEEIIQDAVTRNIQLLAKVCSQIPQPALAQLKETYGLDLLQCIQLQDALFMNVDLVLLWNTVTGDLVDMQKLTQDTINAIASGCDHK